MEIFISLYIAVIDIPVKNLKEIKGVMISL
jgi:hypothetical protein